MDHARKSARLWVLVCVRVFASYSSNNSNKSAISVWAKWMMSAKWLDTRNVQNKNKTPPSPSPVFPFTESSACECEHEWICQLFKTLRTGTFRQFSVRFHCAGSFNKYNILRIILSKAIHQARKWTHTHALFRTYVSVSGVGRVYLNGSKRNSVIHYAREKTTTSSHRIHKEIKSIWNEWIYAWNTDLNVHFEIKHERYVCVRLCQNHSTYQMSTKATKKTQKKKKKKNNKKL